MLRDIVFCTYLDVLCRGLLGDEPARKEVVAVWLQVQGGAGKAPT